MDIGQIAVIAGVVTPFVAPIVVAFVYSYFKQRDRTLLLMEQSQENRKLNEKLLDKVDNITDRVSKIEGQTGQISEWMGHMERRMVSMDNRMGSMDGRMGNIAERVSRIEGRMGSTSERDSHEGDTDDARK